MSTDSNAFNLFSHGGVQLSTSDPDYHEIELRSDTFTKPTAEMRQAMFEAHVGDDVYREDPTMNNLERTVADLFAKEASLFMPSGTMANLIAVMCHCYERGSEIIVGDKSHFNLWEQGGASQIGGIYVKQIENLADGTFDLEKLETMFGDYSDSHCCRTRVVCIENTHNNCGGRVLPLTFVERLRELCDKHGVKIHLDGSRLMNASLACNVGVNELTQHCDSVNFCFSKGLGAPVGSILIGTKPFIQKAERMRKVLGGGMRQVGILAAACLLALSRAKENLTKDHANAKRLAQGIANGIDNTAKEFLSVDVESIQTNIVHVHLLSKQITSGKFAERLETVTQEEVNELGAKIVVKVGEADPRTIRLLTHLDVSASQIEWAIKKINYVCKHIANLKH